MATKVFINLPVKNLDKSVAFFTALGYSFNPQFTDEKATCMIISENIFAMLLTEAYFKTFTRKEVADAKVSTEVLIALDASSREEVQQMVAKAKDAGGTIYAEPQDYGWMYQHSFADLDGHQWELVYMDAAQMPAPQQ
ncbi:MAG: VOC family protein [Chitinophaga sp.]|uniref:VOC family protein n=1 Tax=Chitinophaga sp. TaxID=1869181 RepID=UPI001B254813|nr:VOC family protein [Chitinophaga sp.]MBO9729778.1 VOC family protein [Chitinophaga sp.]